ncbi:10176_t:CDS:2 [Entrophospora sp. SA101]|nr:10176_t:CDS:2 [Entrophospora sp. SA101]
MNTSNEHVDKVTDDDEQLTVGCEKTSTNDEVDEDNPTSSIVYVHVSDVKKFVAEVSVEVCDGAGVIEVDVGILGVYVSNHV